ncbi:MAG: hypothetical protein GF384_06865 [Elusimicrobia bacterium]|nr:hypothetical protein [Elusimicrobiota bacterium]MBD3412419.1 hypothetical protein [Elusimicrobiota bacterium]
MKLKKLINYCLKHIRPSVPFIIGVGGPSGVGKSFFAHEILKKELENRDKKVLVISLDSFFETRHTRDAIGSEWDERHVRIDELRRVFKSIVQGKQCIQTRRRDRTKKNLIFWTIFPAKYDIIMLEGLYAISSDPRLGNLSEFVDLPIYITAKKTLVKQWRFQQEKQKKDARTQAAMNKHWYQGIVPDTVHNVKPSKKNALVVLRKTKNHEYIITQFPR